MENISIVIKSDLIAEVGTNGFWNRHKKPVNNLPISHITIEENKIVSTMKVYFDTKVWKKSYGLICGDITFLKSVKEWLQSQGSPDIDKFRMIYDSVDFQTNTYVQFSVCKGFINCIKETFKPLPSLE